MEVACRLDDVIKMDLRQMGYDRMKKIRKLSDGMAL
jgi:hypothetical protein